MVTLYDVTSSKANKDLRGSREETRELLMHEFAYESALPLPPIVPSPERPDLFIVDFAQCPVGFKAYGAENIIKGLSGMSVGYAAPRVGHAAEAIAYLCEINGVTGRFFAPASKEASRHQAVVTSYKGCSLDFCRIPAMPVMNSYIREWASRSRDRVFLPFGLSGMPGVTAGIVQTMTRVSVANAVVPQEMWCAVSTGTMIRALQIAYPNCHFFGIAVARNIKDGEIGQAIVESYHRSFYEPADVKPLIETTMTYDAKAYEIFLQHASPGAFFLNVGSDAQIEKRLEGVDIASINSSRAWGDLSAFNH